jgi:hypothetical protein
MVIPTFPKGFAPKPLTAQQITDCVTEFTAITSGNIATATRVWSKEKILTTMGLLNILIYRAAREMKVLVQVKKAFRTKTYKQSGFHRVVENIGQALSRGVRKFRCGMQTVALYLKTYWKGANTGRTTLWKTKKMLSDTFNLFTCEERKFKAGQWGQATVIQNFNFAKALLLYEHLENLLRQHYGEEKDGFDGLPEHKGAIISLVFNKFFAGVVRYRRKELALPDPREEVLDRASQVESNQYVKPRNFTFEHDCEYILKDGGLPLAVLIVCEDGCVMSAKKAHELWRQRFTRHEAEPSLQVDTPFPENELPY